MNILAALLCLFAFPATAQTPTQTPSQMQMKAALGAYFDAMNAGDTAKLKSMFSDDAMIEDPFGTPLRTSNAFFDRLATVKLNFKILAVTAPAMPTAAAAVNLTTPNGTLTVIELFTFKPDGNISSLKAYWGSDDRKQ